MRSTNLLLVLALAAPLPAFAEEPPEMRTAAEINVLWPFIGISELKVVFPIFGDADFRGELVTGVYADYAQIVRQHAGKVALLAAITGYRQFFGYGVHAEVTLTTGLRHEIDHPGDGAKIDDFYVRAWPAFGWQLELSPSIYANARARLGVLVYRSSHVDEERKLVPAGDVNLGFRF